MARGEDIWVAWLRRRRTGGDTNLAAEVMRELAPVRDAVLDHAVLTPGETLLDVGCGDGLIAFGALERGAGRVIFSDVSDPLLDDCRATASELAVLDRCDFVRASADALPFDDGLVDAVTTRSVLVYVEDKAAAFREFHRVLRSGGRLSIFEPINVYFSRDRPYWPWDWSAQADLRARIDAYFARYQPADDPMIDFDERDLLRLTEEARFAEVHMELKVDIRPVKPASWQAVVDTARNPKVPTLGEAIAATFAPEERERFERHLRPLVEAGAGVERRAGAYLWAVKR